MNARMYRGSLKQFIRAGIPALCCLLLCSVAYSQAPTQTDVPLPPKRDSVFAERQIETDDSLATPLQSLGRVAIYDDETLVNITKSDRRLVQYRSTSELLIRGSHLMPLSHGGNAQHNSVSVAGGLNADLTASANGRPLLDVWSNSFHLMQTAPEGFERIEILTGTDAVGLGSGAGLSAMNFQDIRHNSASPYTALWYTQGGGDIVGVDGTFSQNVARGVNLTFGVRRIGASDERYVNTEFDVWNVRAAVRYTPSEIDHLHLSYQLSSLNTGLWGGLRTIVDLDSLTERISPPVFASLKDETRRHDVTATYVRLFDTDSSFTLTTQLFGSVNNMLRLRDTTLRTSDADSVLDYVAESAQMGGLVRMEKRIGNLLIRGGAIADYLQASQQVYAEEVNELRTQFFGHVRLQLSNMLTVGAATRITNQHSTSIVGAGAFLKAQFAERAWLKADLSTSGRAPSSTEGFSLNSERTMLATLTGYHSADNLVVEAQAFFRSTSNPLITSSNRDENQFITTTQTVNADTRTTVGFTAQATMSWQWFELRPIVRAYAVSTTNGVADSRFPGLMGELYASGVYRMGANSVRVGVRGVVVTPFTSQQFVPLTWTYISPVQEQQVVNNGLDLLLVANLGNATVRFSYENIFSQRWYTTAVAPEIEQDVRLSVTWSFFD